MAGSFLEAGFRRLYLKYGPLPQWLWEKDFQDFFFDQKEAAETLTLRFDALQDFWLTKSFFTVAELKLSGKEPRLH